MPSNETLMKLADLFISIADLEKQIENSRQNMAQCDEFDSHQLYLFLDQSEKSGLDAVDFLNFIKNNNIHTTIAETQFFIQCYDKDEDGIMSYPDFLSFILPSLNEDLRKIARNKVGINFKKEKVDLKVELLLGKILEKELILIRTILNKTNELKKRNDFNVHELFHFFTVRGITEENMSEFLKRSGLEFDQNDIRLIFRRIDLLNDGIIDFREFHLLFSFPDSPSCCDSKNYDNCSCASGCSVCIGNNKKNTKRKENKEIEEEMKQNEKIINRSFQGNIQNSFMNNSDINRSAVSEDLFNKSRRNNPNEIKELSPNLELRLRSSPRRKFSPFKEPPLNHSPNAYEIKGKGEEYFPNEEDCCSLCCYPKVRCTCCDLNKCLMLFMAYYKEVMRIECLIEKAKIDLAIRKDFNLEDAFNIFELNDRDLIRASDLQFGLSELNVYASPKDISLIMNRGDLKNKGILTYPDFFDLLIPYEKDYRNMVEERPPSNVKRNCKKTDVFALSTKIYLQNLFRTIIKGENQLDYARQGLKIISENLRNIYYQIDIDKKGFISYNDFQCFFSRNGCETDERSIGLAFIRLDRNRNGKVELWEIGDDVLGNIK